MGYKLTELNVDRINPQPLSASLMILLRLSHILVGFILIIAFSGCSGEESEEEITKQFNEPSVAGDTNETAAKTEAKPVIQFIRETTYGSADDVMIGVMGPIAIGPNSEVFIRTMINQRFMCFIETEVISHL